MKIPEFLKKGDQVAITCTASRINGDVREAVQILESWGLHVQVKASVSSSYHTFAGTDELRRDDLQSALDDPNIKAVFAARGGYGTVRIIDNIDFSTFLQKPKWLIGFSDITVLHSHIHQLFGIPTIHGQMPKTFEGGTKTSLESLRKVLFGEKTDIEYTSRSGKSRPGKSEGILIGGNLAILHSLVGSPSDMNFDGKILFIEDVGEPYYNIDRMLWTLKRAGKFKYLKGIIAGGFSSMKDSQPSFGQSIEDIILDKVREYDYPVAFGFPAGHIANNHAIVFGKNVSLSVIDNKINLKYI